MGRIFCLAAALAIAAAAAPARAQTGPSLNSFFMNVTKDGDCCGHFSFGERLPAGRHLPLPGPTMSRLGRGRYAISAPGAAPFPEEPGPEGHAGFFVAVTTVGGDAHCFEVSTVAIGFTDLLSTVACVDPRGAPVDSAFSWSYRADSLAHPQRTPYRASFAYAHVRAGGRLGSWFVARPGARPRIERRGAGAYRVTFAPIGFSTGGFEHTAGPAGETYAQVSPICDPGRCGTVVCAVDRTRVSARGWSADVRCSDGEGRPADTDLRVLVGREAMNSQSVSTPWKYQRYNEATNHGWIAWSDSSTATGDASLRHARAVHVNQAKEFPGNRPVTTRHPATGRYRVTFHDQIVYGPTYWSLHVTSRDGGGGAYCTIGDFDDRVAAVDVTCFDGQGVPRDGRWFLNMRRQYNN